MQPKKDWITAARKVSANTNSPGLTALSDSFQSTYSPAHTPHKATTVSTRKTVCVPIYSSLPALHTIWPLEIKCICFHLGAVQKKLKKLP